MRQAEVEESAARVQQGLSFRGKINTHSRCELGRIFHPKNTDNASASDCQGEGKETVTCENLIQPMASKEHSTSHGQRRQRKREGGGKRRGRERMGGRGLVQFHRKETKPARLAFCL